MPNQDEPITYEIFKFITKEEVARTYGDISTAEKACIYLYQRSGKRSSYYYRKAGSHV